MATKLISLISTKFRELTSIETRSLGLFRIGLGLLLCSDLFARAPYIWDHYTDSGVLPRGALLSEFAHPYWLSLHLASGQYWFQAILFVVAFAFALAMLLGYRTRFVTVCSWVMLISLQSRNYMVLQGGDILLRVLMFWAMFLPLGARYSFDRFLNSNEKVPERVHSTATVAILLQVGTLYLFAAFLKSGDSWQTGEAARRALMIDQFTTPLGHFMLGYPTLLKALTHFTYWLEHGAFYLLFFPFFNQFFRLAGVFLLFSMHLGFLLCMKLGLFPWIDFVSFTVFLPSLFWRYVPRDLPGRFFSRESVSELKETLSRWIVPPASTMFRIRSLTSMCLGLLLVVVMAWNTVSVFKMNVPIPEAVRFVMISFRLDQHWAMFAPEPPLFDGWYVISGKTKNGQEVDVYNQRIEPVSWEKPELVSSTYPSQRWRKYMMNLTRDRNSKHLLYFGRYLCRRWNGVDLADEQKLVSFTMNFMVEPTLPDGTVGPIKRQPMWKHECFSKEEPSVQNMSGRRKMKTFEWRDATAQDQ